MRALYFDLGVDYEIVPHEGKGEEIIELITALEHQGRVSELEEKIRQLRPHLFKPRRLVLVADLLHRFQKKELWHILIIVVVLAIIGGCIATLLAPNEHSANMLYTPLSPSDNPMDTLQRNKNIIAFNVFVNGFQATMHFEWPKKSNGLKIIDILTYSFTSKSIPNDDNGTR